MSKVKHEVKTFHTNYECDQCGEGYMVPTGVMLASNPPKYPHRCNNCAYKITFRVKYPIIHYENIEVKNGN